MPARIQAIEQACAEEDLDALSRLAHQLEGSAGGYGFPTITDAAGEAAVLAKVGTVVPELVDSVEALTELCRRAIRGAHKPEQSRDSVRTEWAR